MQSRKLQTVKEVADCQYICKQLQSVKKYEDSSRPCQTYHFLPLTQPLKRQIGPQETGGIMTINFPFRQKPLVKTKLFIKQIKSVFCSWMVAHQYLFPDIVINLTIESRHFPRTEARNQTRVSKTHNESETNVRFCLVYVPL